MAYEHLMKSPAVGMTDDNDSEKVDVEIIDDTPEADKNRKPLTTDPLDKPDTEEEAAKLAKGVQKRINELTHKAHDERRRAEKAERELNEATTVASAALQRSRLLEQQLTSGEAAFANESTEKAELALKAAKAKFRQAYEAGDPDAQADAQSDIAAATQQLTNAKHWGLQARQRLEQSALQIDKEPVDSGKQQPPSQRQAATEVTEPDDRATDWAQSNPWFGVDPVMTSMVYGKHEALVKSGLHPVNDADAYYAAINEEMRKRFPEYQWQGDDGEVVTEPAKTATKKPVVTVAPVTRPNTSAGNTSRRVTLSATEVRMAERLGLTPEQYAREKIKLNKV